jgi:hypothetical protein
LELRSQPAEDGSGYHIMGDVLGHLGDGWDLMIAHPPCTYLSRAGARWWKDEKRHQKSLEAAAFVLALWNAPIERIAIENPIGKLNLFWRHPDQTVNPFQFGDPYSKATCLWLKNLPPLMDTLVCAEYTPWVPANTSARKRRGQEQPGKASRLDRSRTFLGIARAMAQQWGGPVAHWYKAEGVAA